MGILKKGADHEDNGGEEDKHKWDDSHNTWPETETWVLEQVPPPLLGAAHAGVGEHVHVIFLPHGSFLHLVLATIVYLLTTWLYKQFTNTPVGQLFTECNWTCLRGTARKVLSTFGLNYFSYILTCEVFQFCKSLKYKPCFLDLCQRNIHCCHHT